MKNQLVNRNKNKKLFTTLALLIFLLPSLAISQNNKIKVSDSAIENYRIGLYSGNKGITKCCLYFAGKYELNQVCPDLVKFIETTKDKELCKIALWSLYKIGDNEYCVKINSLLKENKSKEIIHCYNFLKEIKEYENELTIGS